VLEDFLRTRPDLVAAADGARIKISGCPNGCGQHHIATIGFQGSVRRLGGRAVPQYFVMVGGGAAAKEASFARLAAKIPARRLTEAVERLINWYSRDRVADESAAAFFARVDVAQVRDELADLEQLTEQDATAADYIDLGEAGAFNPEVMDGECSA
jgi:sulfite reductase (NADPH) hemoprotein beta-component